MDMGRSGILKETVMTDFSIVFRQLSRNCAKIRVKIADNAGSTPRGKFLYFALENILSFLVAITKYIPVYCLAKRLIVIGLSIEDLLRPDELVGILTP
jgi:hypothetical protein